MPKRRLKCENCGDFFFVWPSVIKRSKPRFCSHECHGETLKWTEKQFWQKVTRLSKRGCWLWTGAVTGGYGNSLGPDGKRTTAHRVAWTLVKGKIPSGFNACHNCPGGDNPLCVNPRHLFVGTQRDNSFDSIRKRRPKQPSFKRYKKGLFNLPPHEIDEIARRVTANCV